MVHAPRGKLNVGGKQETVDLIEGDVECRSYDSIPVSYTWELTSVSMRYSQGDGLHTPLSRLVLYPLSVVSECLSTFVLSCVILRYPRHGHVLTGTIIIKINVCTRIIPAGLKRPPPSKTISSITWFEA